MGTTQRDRCGHCAGSRLYGAGVGWGNQEGRQGAGRPARPTWCGFAIGRVCHGHVPPLRHHYQQRCCKHKRRTRRPFLFVNVNTCPRPCPPRPFAHTHSRTARPPTRCLRVLGEPVGLPAPSAVHVPVPRPGRCPGHCATASPGTGTPPAHLVPVYALCDGGRAALVAHNGGQVPQALEGGRWAAVLCGTVSVSPAAAPPRLGALVLLLSWRSCL